MTSTPPTPATDPSPDERLIRLLTALSEAPGPTGFEGPVRAIVRRELADVATGFETDGLGSLVATLPGARATPRVLLSAHMDELGLLVKRITPEGYLKFTTLGGWLDQAIVNQRWLVLTARGPVPAISGIKTVHVMSPEARTQVFKRDDLFLDVGAADAAAVAALGIRPGDPVVPDSRCAPLGDGRYVGKAWDDRVGVAVLIEAMRTLHGSGHPNTVVGMATVQEEVGLRGAETGAYLAAADVGINLEAGVAGDYPGITADEAQERLGGGPSLFLHDASMLPNLRLRDLVVEAAAAIDVPLQLSVIAGYGEDGAAVQRTRSGTPTVNIGIPTRYLHAHHGVIDIADVQRAIRLVAEVVRRLDATTVAALRTFDE